MSRAFDNRQSFFDNEGLPLVGRISFYKKGTSELETITDVDNVPLSNPIFTNTIGQTVTQVFLKDKTDYTINFEKYIGQGDFTDDEDIDNWLFQYSAENLWNTYGVEIISDSVLAVDTIEDLKNYDPAFLGDRNYIQVLGYNSIGDCEPVYYRWDENSVEDTNGGSIIASDVAVGQGRWKLINVFGDDFDVRHFGVFGAITRNLAPDSMGSQITAAQTYANSIGKKLYFPAIDNDLSWYNVKTVQTISNGKFDSNVYLFDESNGTHYITCTETGVNLYGAAHFILMSDTIKTSWVSEATNAELRPASVLYFDANISTSYKSVSGIIVRGNTQISDWSFTNCIFEVIGLLNTNNTFNNCKLEGRFFTADAEVGGMCTNCQVDVDDFKDRLDLYKEIRLTSDPNPNFDYDNLLSSENPINYYNSNVVTSGVIRIANFNAVGEVTIGKIENTVLELHNCTGQFKLNSYGYGDTILIKGCRDIEITNLANGGVNLMIEDSAVIMPTKTIKSLSVKDSTITNGTITCDDFTSYSSILSTAIVCKNVVVKDSQINSNITQNIDGTCSTFFDNNIFNAQLTIAGATGTQIVNGTITNNIGNYSTPIVINRTHLDSVDANHHYTYDNNKGTFPKRNAEFTQDVSIINDIQNFTGYEWVWTLGGGYGASIPWLGFSTYYYDDGSAYYRHHFKFTQQFSVFRIGTDDEIVDVDWKMNSINSNTGYIMPFKFKAKIVHTNGESYRLEGAWIGGAPTSPQTAQGEVASILNVFANVTALGVATMNATFKLSLEK